jgi:hypothetical protein
LRVVFEVLEFRLADAALFEEEDIAVERRVGKSSTSERRSIFRESSRAFRRRSRRGFVFSARRL